MKKGEQKNKFQSHFSNNLNQIIAFFILVQSYLDSEKYKFKIQNKISSMTLQNKRFIGIMFTILVILLIPIIGMLFSNEVKWSLFDFLVAGVLLLGTGLSIELILRKVKTTKMRILGCVGILFIVFVVWAELAVGIFGSPFAGR